MGARSSTRMDGAVHFHLLHDRDHEWLKHMVNPVTGEVTEGAEIHRGLEVERGKFGLLTGEELSAAADGA